METSQLFCDADRMEWDLSDKIEIVIFLLVLTVRYPVSLSSAQNIRLICRSLFHSLYFMSILLYIHYV